MQKARSGAPTRGNLEGLRCRGGTPTGDDLEVCGAGPGTTASIHPGVEVCGAGFLTRRSPQTDGMTVRAGDSVRTGASRVAPGTSQSLKVGFSAFPAPQTSIPALQTYRDARDSSSQDGDGPWGRLPCGAQALTVNDG